MTENQKKPTKTDQPRPGYLEVILIALIIAMITATLVIGTYDRRYAQKIVTVDLKGYIQEQRDRLLAGEIDDDGLRAALDHMETTLAATPDNHVLILNEVVLRNAKAIDLGKK